MEKVKPVGIWIRVSPKTRPRAKAQSTMKSEPGSMLNQKAERSKKSIIPPWDRLLSILRSWKVPQQYAHTSPSLNCSTT